MIIVARWWTMLDGGACLEVQLSEVDAQGVERMTRARHVWVGPGLVQELIGGEDHLAQMGVELTELAARPGERALDRDSHDAGR